MSSLLKMNQKFLSKSSWSIRGGGKDDPNKSNNQSPRGLQTNSSSHNGTSKLSLFSPSSNGASKTPTKHRLTLYRDTGNSNGSNQYSPQHSHHVNGKSGSSQKLVIHNMPSPSSSSSAAVSHANPAKKQHQFVDSPLKRSAKGMSHSITDLREASEKPVKVRQDDNVEFTYEIRERRIDMYIAEIEMEPVYQLGSTIR